MKALLMLSLLVLAACRPPVADKPFPDINHIDAGTTFRINLPEDHKSGYTWSMTNDECNCIHRISDVWHGPTKGLDINMKAVTTGVCTLKFVLRKFTDTAEIKQVIVKIDKRD